MTLQELREKRAKLAAQARKLVEENPGDAWTDDYETEFNDLEGEIAKVDAEISRKEKVLSLVGDSPGVPDSAVAVAADATAGHQIEVKHKRVYRNLGEQLQDVQAMTLQNDAAPAARDRFEKVVNAAGASTGMDGDGGYLVETDHSSDIIETAIETGVLSSRCARQPIGANSDGFSYLAAKDRDRSTGKSNGIQVYRKSEAEDMKDSGKVQLEERELRLEDLYGLVYVTNRMLRDATALAAYTKRMLRRQLSFKLDLEIFQGTGAGQPVGIMNSDLPVVVPKESEQTAGTITAPNVLNMLARFYGNIAEAAWFVNQDTLPQFPQMTIGNQPVFMPGGSFEGAPFGTLLGRPIVPVEFCKTLGSKGDIVLGDFGQYLLIEKGGVEEAESVHVKFISDETAFRFLARNNGHPLHDQPITPLNGSNTLSPFVMLAERS